MLFQIKPKKKSLAYAHAYKPKQTTSKINFPYLSSYGVISPAAWSAYGIFVKKSKMYTIEGLC